MPTVHLTTKVLNDFRKMKLSKGRDPISLMKKAMEQSVTGFVALLKSRYLRSQKASDFAIAARTRKLLNSTRGEVKQTSKYTVVGRIIVGEDAPYTPLHVGTSGRVMETYTSKTNFVIALPNFRNQDGSWRSPFRSGSLRGVSGLFRGSPKHNLKADTLYMNYKNGKIVPVFLLRKTIRIKQRVRLDDITEENRSYVAENISRAFDNLDVASLAQSITGMNPYE